jgi:uncharacterized membrane protein
MRSICLDRNISGIYHDSMSISEVSQSIALRIASSRMMAGFAFLLIKGLVLVMLSSCSQHVSYPSPTQIGPDIVIDTSVLELEVPKFYTYRFQNKQINFFVIKMEDKTLSFLDACASCYPHKQGYRYENNSVVCRYCNVKLSISKLEKGLGNCYPIKIDGKMEKDKYLIPAATLEAAANKF